MTYVMDTNYKYEFMREMLGDEKMLDCIYRALNVETLDDILEYIERTQDLTNDIQLEDMKQYISDNIAPCIKYNNGVSSMDIANFIAEYYPEIRQDFYTNYEWYYYSYSEIAGMIFADDEFNTNYRTKLAQEFGYDNENDFICENYVFEDAEIDGFVVAQYK